MTRDEVVRLLQAHRDELYALGARSVSLFGSVARDEAGPESDIDVLVEFDQPTTLELFVDMLEYIEGLLPRPIHLATPGSIERVRPFIERDLIRVA